jgi:signal transduction histidine kinase
MPTNPWIAVEATTPLPLQARELRMRWHAYLIDGRVDRVRLPIAESWQRSQLAGIDPSHSRAPTLIGDRRDLRQRWEAHPLEAAAPLIRRWLGRVAEATEHLIVVSDADGLLLWVDGEVHLRSAAADAMNFVEGAVWAEAGAGTNAVGTALAADHPVQVHGAEHFSETVHGWTCSAAPVHDPEDGRLLGVIDLTGVASKAHPHTLAATLAAARAVEADLRVRSQVRDAQLRARYLERVTASGEKLALVNRSGVVIADHPDGFIGANRVDVPHGGGTLMLPGGARGIAEPLDDGESYVVRAARGERQRRGPAALARASEWHDAQLKLSRLAAEQAALRRVATMVAGQVTAEEIFATVAEEVASLVGADRGTIGRYDADGAMTIVAYWPASDEVSTVGTRVALEGESVASEVQQSGRTSRTDDYYLPSGPVMDFVRRIGPVPRSTAGAPILVEGRVWGTILASAMTEPLAADTETRLMGFAELVATAISNAVARGELHASRARIVAAGDGAQQRLVAVALELRAAAENETAAADELRDALARAANAVNLALEELRETARGIHPAILSEAGLAPALRVLAARAVVPVDLDVSVGGRMPEAVEVAAYYVVSELLTNAVKHARASVVRVAVERLDHWLHVAVNDDGVGGADPGGGSGLIGLRDRVEAIGGTIGVTSPAGAGTTVLVSLPLD